MSGDETHQIIARYERRKTLGNGGRDSILLPHRYLSQQEKEKHYLRLFLRWGINHIAELRVLEIGCGDGVNLLQLLRWGFQPQMLVGNELLPDRCEAARRVLPSAVQILQGDATQLALPDNSFDIVLQSTVFTSILDDQFQRQLAGRMWSLVKPGGGILWYDFVYNNPKNPDVRGVNRRRIRQLFPHGRFQFQSATLAPPLARAVTTISPRLYGVFNSLPFLRTHLFCWIEKSISQTSSQLQAA